MKRAITALLCIVTSCSKDIEFPPDVDLSYSMVGSWQYEHRRKSIYTADPYYYDVTETDYEGYNMLWLHSDSTYLKIFQNDTTMGNWSITYDGLYYINMTEGNTASQLYIPIFNKETLMINEKRESIREVYTQVLKRVR